MLNDKSLEGYVPNSERTLDVSVSHRYFVAALNSIREAVDSRSPVPVDYDDAIWVYVSCKAEADEHWFIDLSLMLETNFNVVNGWSFDMIDGRTPRSLTIKLKMATLYDMAR
jgi:hypothetical protein